MRFRDFAPYIQPEVGGCPLFQIDMAVREACISLLSRADLWRADPDMLNVTANQATYDLSAPTGSEPSRIISLTNAGKPLAKAASEEEIYSILDSAQPGTPTHYYQHDNETVILAPMPKEPLQLRLHMALKPNAASTAIPDGIGKEWRKLIAIGAKAHLMLMAKVTWSNPQLGQLNLQLFERGVGSAIRRSKTGNNGAPLTVQRRDFF